MAADPELAQAQDDAVRVTTSGVHARPSGRPPGNRGVWLALAALVAVAVVAGLALRPAPTQTAQSTPSHGEAGAVAATDSTTIQPTALEPSTTEPDVTPDPNVGSTLLPTIEPTKAATTAPTKKPRPAATRYVEPTDSHYTEWTPPPGFEGSVTLTDNCLYSNGLEEVLLQADFNSPVDVAEVMFYKAGTDNWINPMGGPPAGQERVGTVIVSHQFEVGSTIVVEARFIHGDLLIDLIAKRQSEPHLVQQGPACPGG